MELIFFRKNESRRIVFCNNLFYTQAMAALNEFSCAEHDPSNVIRSRPAYLMGVLRKYRSGNKCWVGLGKPSMVVLLLILIIYYAMMSSFR